VEVWNIGSLPSAPTRLLLMDSGGEIHAHADVEVINWPEDLKPASRKVTLKLAGPLAENVSAPLKITVNDEQKFAEITFRNNALPLKGGNSID